MNNKLLKVLSLLLTVAMLLSLAACKPKSKKKDKKKDKTTAQQGEIADSTLSGEFGDIDLELEDEPFDLIIARPVTDLGISTGVKLAFSDGEDEELGEDLDEEGFEEITDEETYVSPVSKFGSDVKGNTRNFDIDNSNGGIIHKDFQKFGCNVFPTMFTVYAQNKDHSSGNEGGDNIAYRELNAKRYNDIHASYARSWFQIDWMVTNYANDPVGSYSKYKDNPEENPDYIAYSKGDYDFENDWVQSCVEYWRMLGEAGTRVEVAFGWKVAKRVQSWFGEDPSRPELSAPKDLKRYADAAKELLIYCYDQGLRNVDVLGFYNEPHRVENSSWRDSWDFATVGDKRIYWGQMATLARKALDTDKRTKNVEIWGTEVANSAGNLTLEYLNVYLYKYYSNILDVFTFHEYYATYLADVVSEGCYNNWYDVAGKVRGHYKDAVLAVTEFYAADRDVPDQVWGYNWYKYGGWNSSYCSYLIALANNGWHAGLTWGYTGGWIPDPIDRMVGGGDPFATDGEGDAHVAWSRPHSVETAEFVHYNFYTLSLLNNYIPDHANVHSMTYEGKDLHASAFTSADGKDFTLLVEKNEGGNALNFKVNLEKSLGGKDVNVFRFTYENSARNTDRNGQATIPELYDTIKNVKNRFSYTEKATEKGKYTIYVFTTLKPLAQIEIYSADTGDSVVSTELNINEESNISFKPVLIDCPSNTKIEWEIKEYSVLPDSDDQLQIDKTQIKNADLGKITTNGNTVTYTPAADAKKGDVVALRVKIKGTNRFASTMIHIVK